MSITLNIIGGGRAAQTLARLWQQQAVLSIGAVCNRSDESARRACDFIGAGTPCVRISDMPAAELWLLGVPDNAIAPTAQALADSGRVRVGNGVFHLSGFTSSAALAPLQVAGASVASVHPVMSFARPERAVTAFAGTLCGVEGDEALVGRLQELFEMIGGECFALSADQKPLYHAGSVFASNFLVVLQEVARTAYCEAGVAPEVADRLSIALARGALDNVAALGPAQALTGPAARGERDTVALQHRAVSEWDEEAGRAYRAMSDIAFRLAGHRS